MVEFSPLIEMVSLDSRVADGVGHII